jgi:hypothetical protein
MSTVEEIKTAITHLSEEEFRELRAWYEQWDAQQWDDQLADDVAAGRLDALADAAIHAFQTGKTTEL